MLPSWYTQYKDFVNSSIETYLNTYFQSIEDISKPTRDFTQMIQYAATGGKRFRAILALEFYLTLTNKKFEDLNQSDDIVKCIIAIELLHSYSLVHDDLPCMDNDEYRRGQLTVWKKYGEYQAVLVGDSLNTLCFEILSQIQNPLVSKKVSQLISRSVGVIGMIGGQIDDMYYESQPQELTKEILEKLHNKKTGKLIEASVVSGIILSEKNLNIQQYSDFGKMLGLAFQIKDDILDVEGNFEQTGKSVGGETKGFVHIYGLDLAKQLLSNLVEKCENSIKSLDSKKLNFMVEYVAARKQ